MSITTETESHIFTLDEVELKGKRVLVRVDFNVPLEAGEDGRQRVADDMRIRAALPTIRAVTEAGGRVILMSHLGRPRGEPDPALSLAPVADRLEELLEDRVRFVSNDVGRVVRETVESMPEGGVLMLENTRFQPGEKRNSEALAEDLASLADVYVNDAFGASHRAHASTTGVAGHVKVKAIGRLFERELSTLHTLLEQPAQPFTAVLGGAKVSDKIGVIEALLERVDRLLIGGAMSYTFMKALERPVGASRVEDDLLDEARTIYERAEDKIILPRDHVVAEDFDNDAPHRIAEGEIPRGMMGLDIGPATIGEYRKILLDSQTIVWNGPMGVFEMSNFSKGTFAIAEALAEASDGGAMTVVGGGDSVAAVNRSGYADRISHISTGGCAMLAFLEGKALPALEALQS